MIRIITRCLSESKLQEKKWDYHFAFFHFKEYKNKYLNGKPLKWYSFFKNDDIIEILERPNGKIFSNVADFFSNLLTFNFIGAAAAIIGFGVSMAVSYFGNKSTPQAATSSSGKEYSSSTQPELNGASNSISENIIPVVFGKTQQTPNYGQLSYRLVGDGNATNKYLQYFVSNYNNVVISDEKLGNTSINNYSVDYLDFDYSYGGSAFIGFDNVKTVTVNQQLSYNNDERVDQNASHIYNEIETATSLKIDFVLRFTNVDLSNWGNKTFRLTANILDNTSSPIALTQDYTIASGDLTLVSTRIYTYSGTKTWTQNITELKSTQFAPTANTRTNSVENINQLNSLYVSEAITLGAFTSSLTLNQSINKYLGVVSEVIQTSPDDTVEIDIITSFHGLYHQNTDGSRSNRAVNIDIMYKTDSTDYVPISNATSLYVRDINGVKRPLSSSTTTVDGAVVTVNSPSDLNVADQLFFRPIGMVLPKGKYTVRVRSADFADKTNYDIGYPECAEIQFRVDGDVLDTSILPKVNQISFIATAYGGLEGTLQKYNYIAEARIPIWDGNDWDTIDKTTNPAAIIRHLLTSTLVNPRAIPLSYIDNDSIVELYNWCDSEGFKASGIVSDEIKISAILNEILSNCRAAMIPMLDGKHTFVIDKPDKIPQQMFNQHNSWDFKRSIKTGRQTEAIRASFINNETYTNDELTVYYWSNGTIHETPETGKTDSDYEIIKKDYQFVNDRASVLSIATYELELAQTKRSQFEFNINLEGLTMKLFDRIFVSNSTNMLNESSGQIKDVITSSGNLIGFRLYSEIEIPTNAKVVIRSLDYINETIIINTYDVTNTGTSDIISIEPIVYDGNIKGQCEMQGIQDKWQYNGDLFIIGQDTIHDCIVTDIKYNEDMTATITARDY